MNLWVLTSNGSYLLFPIDTSPSKPFSYTSYSGAGDYWTTYPSQAFINAHLNISFNGWYLWVLSVTTPSGPGPAPGPSPGVNFPHLVKPAWLISFLASCNWQVFTWYINPGDWIEDAIDWVLDGINSLLDIGEDIASKAVEAWQTLLTIWSDIFDAIAQATGSIWNAITDFADKLVNLWNNVTDWVGGLVADISNWVSSELTYFGNLLGRLGEEWDEFWRYTLPGLIDRFSLDNILQAALAPVFEAINRLTDIIDTFRDFFDDPEKWLLEKIESMLARFI